MCWGDSSTLGTARICRTHVFPLLSSRYDMKTQLHSKIQQHFSWGHLNTNRYLARRMMICTFGDCGKCYMDYFYFYQESCAKKFTMLYNIEYLLSTVIPRHTAGILGCSPSSNYKDESCGGLASLNRQTLRSNPSQAEVKSIVPLNICNQKVVRAI